MSMYSSTILTDTPKAYYRLDETSGTTAFDSSGNGYNATFIGSITQSQPGALVSDQDASTYLSQATMLQLPAALNVVSWTAITIEFWTNVSGSWQHVAATCDGTNTLVYLNGQVVTPTAPGTIEISSIFDWAGCTQACNLDELAVYNYVLSSNQISNHVAAGMAQLPTPASASGVRLLISDVHYPTIRQETINIDRTANDPIPTFKITLQDDPAHIAISELQEIIFIDAGAIPFPAHNLLVNPTVLSNTAQWNTSGPLASLVTTSGASMSLTFNNNSTGVGLLDQRIGKGAIIPGQSYCLSAYAYASGTISNIDYYAEIDFFDANGTILSAAAVANPPTTANTRFSVVGVAPANTVYVTVNVGGQALASTNRGTLTISNLQFEPMSFTSGTAQMSYPTPWCATGQTNCRLMPDGTTIRQYRLFGGYVTKASAGRYIGPNRQWTITVSGYAWLLQKQLLNDNFSNQTDSAIIKALVTKYFPNQFSTAQVATGATLDVFGYTFNGTMRDAVDALAANANFYIYIDAYRVIYFQPPGYNQLDFMLSDQPDNVTSFPYYNYSYDLDGTQLGNACLVTGGTNISAVEYDPQSIGYYNQKTNGQGIFWRTVNDSTIASNNAARQRAIAEITQYNYAREVVHLTTYQMMIPGYTVLFSSATDGLLDEPLLIQKSTLTLTGFQSLNAPIYECACDLGAFNPDLVNITVKLLRKQLTNTNNIGTPGIGLMVTESTTFVDTITLKIISSNPATYGMGTYGVSTYAAIVPGVPPTQYGAPNAFYGNSSVGYN